MEGCPDELWDVAWCRDRVRTADEHTTDEKAAIPGHTIEHASQIQQFVQREEAMKIKVTSVLVDDQAKVLRFYTDVLGFVKKRDVPLGDYSWLTVVSPDDPDGTELLLEPDGHPAARPFKDALVADGIPFTQFTVDDVAAEYERLVSLGVRFTQPPTEMGPVTTAVLDDTCGNLIQIVTPPPDA